MKNFLLAIAFILFSSSSFAQTFWEWVISAGALPPYSSYNGMWGNGVATDKAGNIYAIGYFYGTPTVGPYTLTGGKKAQMYIIKYGLSGNVIWAKQYGGTGKAIAVGTDNSIYVHGVFSDTIAIGSYQFISKGSEDVFVAKLDTAGSVEWARSGGGPDDDECYFQGMVLDKDNNVIIGGSGGHNASFGNDSIDGGTYLVKYDSDGNVVWAKATTQINSSNSIFDLACDLDGNIITVGGFNTLCIFNGKDTLKCHGWGTALVKFDKNGDVTWTSSIVSARDSSFDVENVFAIDCDSHNNICLFGEKQGYIKLGSVTTTDSMNYFIAKYNSSGNALWTTSFGKPNEGVYSLTFEPNDLKIDNYDDIVVAGKVTDSMMWGSVQFKMPGRNTREFVACFSPSGQYEWLNYGGNTYLDASYICIKQTNEVCVTGSMEPTTDSVVKFETQSVRSNQFTSMYLALIGYESSVKNTTQSTIQVSVYPNPAHNTITVDPINAGTAIRVVDVSGKVLFSKTAASAKETINIAALLPGIYLLQLTDNNNNTKSFRIEKQ